MNWKTRSYSTAILTAGAVLLVIQLGQLQPESVGRFSLFAGLTALAASMRVSLPGIAKPTSLHFLLLLMGMARLSLPELTVGALAAAVLQADWKNQRQRPKWNDVCFDASCSCMGVAAAFLAFHSPLLAGPDFRVLGQLSMASAVLFTVTTAPASVFTALQKQISPLRLWRETASGSFPYYLIGAGIAAGVDQLSLWVDWVAAFTVLPILFAMHHSYKNYLGGLAEQKDTAERTAALHLRTLEALALAIEAKDRSTPRHLRCVQIYAHEIAKDLELSKGETEALQAASVLHDIGKLAVPEHILSKPGRLTPEEFERMKVHPLVGAEILDRVQFPYPVADIVRAHHERWDGAGYPKGLAGEAIPIGARILAAVDTLDALASNRQYRGALPIDQAMQIVSAEAGRAFDPHVVAILERRYRELEVLANSSRPKIAMTPGLVPPLAALEEDTLPARLSTLSPVQPAPEPGAFVESIAQARQEVLDLFELAQALGSSLRLSDSVSMLAMRIRQQVAFDSLVVYLVKGNTLKAEYVLGEDSRLFSKLAIPIGEGLSGWVARNSKPIVNGNPSVEPGYANDPGVFSKLNSALVVPLQGSEDVIGVLALYHSQREAFTSDHLRVLQVIQSKLAIVIENALKFELAESHATIDYVTGLPNARSLFVHLESELARSLRSGEALGVLVSDVDGFKQVNDRFGHNTGNRLLNALAPALKAQCRPYDVVARSGGDEFVLVMPGMTRNIAIGRMAVLDQTTRNVCREICGEELISLSCGDAYFPEDGRSAEELIDAADRRMYQQKKQRKDEHHPAVVA
ncbi:MAG: diguanylate cyclase [Candidatus Solibacter usitatus]|nr:diguanylate cyclase [Candidatus Solibacter usitatus]